MRCSLEFLPCRIIVVLFSAACFVCAGICGCGGTGRLTSGPQLVGLTITPSKSKMMVGQEMQLSLTAVYSDGTTRKETGTVQWQSSTESVATTSSSGLVRAVGAGTVSISASGGGLSATASIAVQSVVPTSIVIAPESVSLALDQSLQLSATATLSDGSTQDVTHSVEWNVADEAIIRIDAGGVVTGLKAGSSQFSAKLPSPGTDMLRANGSASVAAATLRSLQIAARTAAMPLGTAQHLSVQGTYSDNSTADVSSQVRWSSSSMSVASITAAGDVSADGLGIATISASAGPVGASIDLTVGSPNLLSLTISPADARLLAGQSVYLRALGSYTDGSTADLTSAVAWTVADPSVLSIQNGAQAVAVASGTTQVTATLNGLNGTVPVQVRPIALVSYFANSTEQGDGSLQITSGSGNDVGSCAMLYVFGQDQQMTECCGCQIPREGLLTLSLQHNVLNNPLTGIAPQAGTVMLVSGSRSSNAVGACDPTTVMPAGAPKAWITHMMRSAKDDAAATESELPSTELGDELLSGLQAQCTYAQMLGSGAGVCSCGAAQ